MTDNDGFIVRLLKLGISPTAGQSGKPYAVVAHPPLWIDFDTPQVRLVESSHRQTQPTIFKSEKEAEDPPVREEFGAPPLGPCLTTVGGLGAANAELIAMVLERSDGFGLKMGFRRSPDAPVLNSGAGAGLHQYGPSRFEYE